MIWHASVDPHLIGEEVCIHSILEEAEMEFEAVGVPSRSEQNIGRNRR